jgi:type I restriction enzyme S subunit
MTMRCEKIPDGWKIKNIEELLAVIRNGTNENQVNVITKFPVTRIETIADGTIDLSKVGYVQNIDKSHKLGNGDILLSNINSVKHIGKVAFYECRFGDLYHGMNLLLLRFIDGYDKKFFYYCLIRKKSWFEKMCSQAVNQASINQNTIKNCPLIFPESQKEQSKISEILSTVDKAIDKTGALIQKYQRIKQGLMQDLLTKGIDENGNIRSEKTHKFKNSPLGRIPEEWEVVTISNFASKEKNAIVDGPFGSNLKTEHYRESGRPVIQSGFVTSNQFIADKYLYVEESKFRSEKRSIVKGGDIVMAKIGAQCGKCAIMPIDHPHGILAGNSLKITVSKNNSSQYLEALLHYYYDIGRLFLIIATTAQPAVSMSSLKNMLIPRPSEVEQHRIVEYFANLNKKIQKEQINKQKLLSLKSGLMEDLLTGKVRVNHLLN